MKDDLHHFSEQDLANIDDLVYYLKELVINTLSTLMVHSYLECMFTPPPPPPPPVHLITDYSTKIYSMGDQLKVADLFIYLFLHFVMHALKKVTTKNQSHAFYSFRTRILIKYISMGFLVAKTYAG